MARSRAAVVAVAAVLLGSAAVGWWLAGLAPRPTYATVVDTLDGDTIVVRADGARSTVTVRLLGVDTPETHHPRKPVECYGPEAAAYTRSRLSGQRVALTYDVERHDIYGRRLAFVALDGQPYNDELLRLGYARLLVIPPNGAHARAMLREVVEARTAGRGLWGVCE